MYDRNADVYLDRALMEYEASVWGFELVPLIEYGQSFNYDADDLLTLAEGKYEGTTNEREGVVIRGNGISFKAISNRYLLKGGE